MIEYTGHETPVERRNISRMNEVLGGVELTPDETKTLLWLCGWQPHVVDNIISAFLKGRR